MPMAASIARDLGPKPGSTSTGAAESVAGRRDVAGVLRRATPLRAGSGVSYTFALVGFGAASTRHVLERAWGKIGQTIAVLLCAALVATSVLGGMSGDRESGKVRQANAAPL